MNERIKQLRKTLGLTLEKFGAKLGVSKTAINKIESGTNNITDQMFKAICREYNVEPLWLMEGIGPMFIESDSNTLNLVDDLLSGENEFVKNVFKTFTKMKIEDWEALERIFDIYEQVKKRKRVEETMKKSL